MICITSAEDVNKKSLAISNADNQQLNEVFVKLKDKKADFLRKRISEKYRKIYSIHFARDTWYFRSVMKLKVFAANETVV